MLLQVKPQAIAKGVFVEKIIQLLENRGSLLVDDRSVGGFGVLEVGDVLEDGRGALSLIDPVGQWFDVFVEVLPWVRGRV
jgi:hypothetical protein